MKNLKKAASVALCAVLGAAMFTACGGAKTGSGDKFYIGGIGPTTGGAAIYGSAVMNAAQIAVDEINAAGGINGYQVEYRFEDDTHDAEKAVNAYNTLKDWGMQILMGTVTTTPCLAVKSETAADNMFEITPSASSEDVIAGNSNVYQVCFTDPNQGKKSAQYIDEHGLSSTGIAIIYNSSDTYSTGIYTTFKSECASRGLNIVSDTAFTEDTKTDFSTQVQKAIDAGADLVFLPIYYEAASLILSEANKKDYHPVFFGVDGMDGILTLEGFDTSLAEGVMLLTPFSADAEDAKSFVDAYQAKYNEIPNQFGADAYDAIYIIKQALEAGKATPDMSTSDLCTLLTQQMSTMTFEGGLTGDAMVWDENGAVNKDPKAVVIQDGAYVSAE